jgi:hypothetical protein
MVAPDPDQLGHRAAQLDRRLVREGDLRRRRRPLLAHDRIAGVLVRHTVAVSLQTSPPEIWSAWSWL